MRIRVRSFIRGVVDGWMDGYACWLRSRTLTGRGSSPSRVWLLQLFKITTTTTTTRPLLLGINVRSVWATHPSHWLPSCVFGARDCRSRVVVINTVTACTTAQACFVLGRSISKTPTYSTAAYYLIEIDDALVQALYTMFQGVAGRSSCRLSSWSDSAPRTYMRLFHK